MNEREPTYIGVWIRKHRKRLGLNQTDIAQAVGVSIKTVSGWECRDGQRPARHRLSGLSQLFNISLEEVKIATGYCDEKVVLEPIIQFERCGCEGCSVHARCRRAVTNGLPILCEAVTEVDIEAAVTRGMEQELYESRKCQVA